MKSGLNENGLVQINQINIVRVVKQLTRLIKYVMAGIKHFFINGRA